MNQQDPNSAGLYSNLAKSHSRGDRTGRGLPVILINRADAVDRLAFQDAQLSKMGITYLRLEAFVPETLPESLGSSYWKKWRRPLRDEECAQFLSHAVAWEWVGENGPALIIEDDAVLTYTLPEILVNLENIVGMDHLSLEVRGRRKLVGKSVTPIGHGIGGHRLYLDRLGSAAYVLWPKGAKHLMERAQKGATSTDGIAQWSRKIRSFQADPACAVQLDIAKQYGLNPPSHLLRDASRSETLRIGSVSQRIRFIAAQTHKLMRLLRYGLVAERRKIALKPEFFDL